MNKKVRKGDNQENILIAIVLYTRLYTIGMKIASINSAVFFYSLECVLAMWQTRMETLIQVWNQT